MKCPKCDADNEKDAKFCEECGEKLKLSKKINKTLLYSVIGGAVFLVLILAIVLINPFSQERELLPQQTVCNKPYILVGNDCCLDKDDNGICDKDEGYKCPDGTIANNAAECANKIVESVGEVSAKEEKDNNNCIKPLIKSGSGCCVDYNENKICDKQDGILNDGSHIELNFEQGNPPTEVTDGGKFPFDVVVQLKAKDFNLENVVLSLIGFLPEDFGKGGSDLHIKIGTLKPYETKNFRFSNLNFVGDISGNAIYIMRADVAYEYLGRFYEESVDAEVLVKHLIG